MVLYQSLIETPVSLMRALATDDALCALEFVKTGRMARLDAPGGSRTRNRERTKNRELSRWCRGVEIIESESPAIRRVRDWLNRYFKGESADISGLQLEMRGAPFELRVWHALKQIPAGTTTTYGAIAREIGSPGASRAVGMANGANPIAIVVPCHRVIGSNGTLTGYGGGLKTKAWLLSHERRWAREPALF